MEDELKPREKLEKYGPQSLKDEELIAIILRHGIKNYNVFDVSEQILKKYKTLSQLVDISLEEISKEKGVGKVGAINLKAALEIGKRYHLQKLRQKYQKITSPEEAYHVCEDMIYLTKETVRAIFLDSKLHIITIKDISNGTVNMSIAHPRDIFKEAIMYNAVSFILVHNHPSGDPTPSMHDMDITKKIMESGEILGINMNDHIIIGKDSFFSFTLDRSEKIDW